MPIKKAAMKALRQSTKRASRNAKRRSDINALVRKVRQAVAGSDAAKAKDWLRQVTKKLDRAAQKGILKSNTARRKVSRLTLAVNKLLKAAK